MARKTRAGRNLHLLETVVRVRIKDLDNGGVMSGRTAKWARSATLCVVAVLGAEVVSAGDLVLPVAARNQGLAGTVWRTSLALAAGDGVGGPVTVEWYPAGSEGPRPAVTSSVTVPGDGQVVLDDAVGSLFGVNAGGAIVVRAQFALGGFARVYNDQTGQPVDGGTFGQGVPLMTPDAAPVEGVLLGLSQQPVAEQAGFRTNIGCFNPGAAEVLLTAEAWTASGELLGSVTFPMTAGAFWLGPAFDLLSTVPQDLREQRSFLVRLEMQGGGLFCFASVVDNLTGDATTVLPVSAAP